MQCAFAGWKLQPAPFRLGKLFKFYNSATKKMGTFTNMILNCEKATSFETSNEEWISILVQNKYIDTI